MSRIETVKIRGLARLCASMFGAWGLLAAAKGVYDLSGGEPEANLYSPAPWAFITQEQWRRYAGFELVFGLTCLAAAAYVLSFSRFLPETLRRAAGD